MASLSGSIPALFLHSTTSFSGSRVMGMITLTRVRVSRIEHTCRQLRWSPNDSYIKHKGINRPILYYIKYIHAIRHWPTLNVWADESTAGILAREGRKQYVFSYLHHAQETVSVTMPVRLQSWVSPELHPIFQMNLPEGALLEAIRRAIAKIIGDDDLSILLVTGGNQIGRNRFSQLESTSPTTPKEGESLEEILTYPDTKELFHELVHKYAIRSGVSGVQPKILLDATERGALSSSSYIVKTWGVDYPHLAANEFFWQEGVKGFDLRSR
jgi:HipA-like protein